MKLEDYLDYVVDWMQQAVHKANAKGVVVGVSGGVDSAVAAALAKKAFPNNYMTVWAPIESPIDDKKCYEELIETLDLKNVAVDLGPTYKSLKNQIEKAGVELTPNAAANMKSRLRMANIYAVGQTYNYLVIGTDNADEWYLGYFTKYGDGAADLLPLAHLFKGEIDEAAKILGVPESIIGRQPTAGLWKGQTDEQDIGYGYDQIDDYLKTFDSKDIPFVERIETLHKNSEHKRQLPKFPDNFGRK